MSLETLSFVLGAILLLAGILGGGFEVKELKIPKISGMARLVAMIAGLAFISLAFFKTPLPFDEPEKTSTAQMSSMDWETNRAGLDYQNFNLSNSDPKGCQEACKNDPQCKAWTYVKPRTIQGNKPRCWLKHARPQPQRDTCCVSGTKL